MKKALMITFLSTLLLLTGCIDIPFGEGKTINISTDGINIKNDEVEDTKEGNTNNEVNQNLKENENKEGNTAEDNTTEDNATANNSSDGDSQNHDTETDDGMECQKDYGSFLERVPKNFPMPDCVTHVKSSQEKSDDYIHYSGSYVTGGSWKEIRDLYRAYLLDEYDITSENEGPTNVRFYYKDDTNDMKIEVDQSSGEEVYVSFWFYDSSNK